MPDRLNRASRVLGQIKAGKAGTRDLQKLLRLEGHDVKVDGIYGPQTDRAWKSHAGELVAWSDRMRSEARSYREAERREVLSRVQQEAGRAKTYRQQGLSKRVSEGLAREPTPYAEAVREVERMRIGDEARKKRAALERQAKKKQGFLSRVAEHGLWEELAGKGVHVRGLPGVSVPEPPKGLQRAAQRANRIVTGDPSAGVQGAGFGGGVTGNLIADITNTTLGFPAGLVKIADATRRGEVKDEFLKPLLDTYKQTYGPALRGDFRRTLKEIEGHPLGPILDAAAIATVGTGATLKTAQVATRSRGTALRYKGRSTDPTSVGTGKVKLVEGAEFEVGTTGYSIRRKGNAYEVRRDGQVVHLHKAEALRRVAGGKKGQVVKEGSDKASAHARAFRAATDDAVSRARAEHRLPRVRGIVPRGRMVRYEGGYIAPHPSPNPLLRIGQHKRDRASEANPEARLTMIPAGKGKITSKIPIGVTAGARHRVSRRLPYELEREFERTAAPAVRLQQARNFVRSPSKIFAYDVLMRYGDKALQRLDDEIAFREDRRHGLKAGQEGKVGLGEAMAQSAQILGLRRARKHLERPSRRFLRAVEAGKDLTDLYQNTKIALGELNEASAGPRVHQPSRIVTGATMEEYTARGEVARIEAELARAPRSTGERAELEQQLARAKMKVPASKPGKVLPGRKQAKRVEASLARLDLLDRELAKTQAKFDKTKGQTRPRTEREAKLLRASMEEELVDDFEAFARKELGIEKGSPWTAFGDRNEQLKRNYHNWLIREFERGERHKGTARALREGGIKPRVKGENLEAFADEFFGKPEYAAKLEALEAVEQGLADLAAFKKGGTPGGKPGAPGVAAKSEEDEFAELFGAAPDEPASVLPFDRPKPVERKVEPEPPAPATKIGPLSSDERAATAQAALRSEIDNVKAKMADLGSGRKPDSEVWTAFLPAGSRRTRKGESNEQRAKRYVADLERQWTHNEGVSLSGPTKVYELPDAFWSDHVARDLPGGRIQKIGSGRVTVELDEAAYRELLSDASHYAKEMGRAGFEGQGLIASAQATMKRLSDDPFPGRGFDADRYMDANPDVVKAALEGKRLEDLPPEQIGQLQAEYAATFGDEALTGAREAGTPEFGAWAERQINEGEPTAAERYMDAIAERDEDLAAYEVWKSARNKNDVPPEMRPYAKNEPGGVAERAAKQIENPEALVDMIVAGEKPASLLGQVPPHIVTVVRARAQKAGLVWMPTIIGKETAYIIAKGQPEAVRLAEALTMTKGPARTAELGRAMGYSERDVTRFTRRAHGVEPPPEKAPLRVVPPALDELSAKRVDKINTDLTAMRALHNTASPGPVKDKLAARIAELEAELAKGMPEPAPTMTGEIPKVLPGQRTVEQVERAAKMPNKPSAADYERFLGTEPTPVSARLGTRVGLLRELRDKEMRSWDRRKPAHQEIKRQDTTLGKRWEGGEEAGEGARFMPDVAQKAVHSLLSRTQGVLGKQQKARYQYQSEGKLFTEGRVRRGPQITLEEFHLTRRRYQRTLDQLRASTFTRPLNPASSTWRDPDWVFFNPNAHKLPPGVRDDPAELVLGMTPAELARSDVNFWEEAFPERINFEDIEAAEAAGVRQIHEEVANAFMQQAPLFVGTRRLHALARAGLGFVDFGNNMTRLGLLYLKGAFVPANFAGNLVFLGIQQGPVAVRSLARGSSLLRMTRDSSWAPLPLKNALEVMSDLRAETLARLDIEVGTGSSLALVSSKGPLGTLTSAVGHVSNVLSDRGPRRAAIIREMEKRGFRTDAQVTRLLDDPKLRPELNIIAEEAENAMVRFRGLGRVEREVLSRIVFIYPWIKGATRYGFHLGMDHPVKAAIVNAIGQEGHKEMVKRLGELVSYLEHLIPSGEPEQKLGTTVVPVRSPLSITPIGTFGEVMGMFGGINQADVPPSKRPGRYLQPTLRAVGEAITGVNWARGYQYQGKTPADILADVTVRQYPIVRGIQTIRREPQTTPFEGSPAKQPLYVKEGGWKAGLAEIMVPGRERQLNLPAAHAKRAAEIRTALSDEQRVLYDDKALRKALVEGAKGEKVPAILAGKGKLDPPLREAITWLTRRNLARVKARNKKDAALNAFEKWDVDAKLALTHKLMNDAQYRRHYARVKAVWEDPDLARSRRDAKITREVTDMGLALFGRDALDDALAALRNKGREVKRPQLLGS